MTALCLYVAVTPVATLAFDQLARTHAQLTEAAFVAASKVTGPAQSIANRLEVRYRWPSHLRLRTLDPASHRLLRERVIEPERTVEYDPSLHQFTVAQRPSGESLGKTLAGLDQDLDDLILAFTASEGFDVWATDMVALAPWSFRGGAQKYSLTYRKGAREILLEVDRARSLLRKVSIKTGADRLVWEIIYQKSVGTLAFVPPKGAYEFPVFDRDFSAPTYADAQARTIAERVFAAYSGLRSLGFDVRRESGTTKVQIAGRFVRQDDGTASWTYDGKTLVLHNKRTGRWYSGKLSFPDVVDAVGSLGTRVDPTARLLMSGYNPYLKRLGDGAEVKVAGTMPLDGRETTILECESDHAIVTLFVRSDGFVVSSSSRAKVAEQDEDDLTDLRYTYFSVPRDAASRLRLRVPVGEKPLTLKPVSN
jgi:hypothetical protein